ncbi:MAG: hypothetical protein QOK26_1418, partial [Pseudonocardiales bacterium]|nr:hypothetical protein [Pseudonocardiales bacterium]
RLGTVTTRPSGAWLDPRAGSVSGAGVATDEASHTGREPVAVRR